MRLKLQLPAKAGQFRISECEATRLLTLSANDFQTFLNWPQKELSWDAQPLYYEEDGKRVYRGVLILGEGRADGVFAYDAGEHFVYLPGARAVVDSILEQAVEKIIKEGTENTNEGSWCYTMYSADTTRRLAGSTMDSAASSPIFVRIKSWPSITCMRLR